jgi:Tetratricopeptide repeat
MLEQMGSPESTPMKPAWQKRLTYVMTSRLVTNTTGRGLTVGTIIPAERLLAVKVRCPRCDAPAATIWRRFDYFGRDLPLYFTKCRRCRRRRPINADEAAFRLLEAGVTDPMEVLHEGIPATAEEHLTADGEHRSRADDGLSVAEAEQLVANRQRAFGKKNRLTFAARAQLAEAVGESGDGEEAARLYEQLLVDQVSAVGHQSPAVLANRYRAAVWTAYAGRPTSALVALRDLLTDEEQILGPDHANTLIVRATIAQLMYETGDRDEAHQMLRHVSQDQVRVLGSEDPATEVTLKVLAEWERR